MQFIYINNGLTVQIKFESVTLLTTAQFNNLIDNVFINIPVESMVHQDNYYLAIRQSTQQTDSAPFIEFMLQMIYDAILEANNSPLNDGLKLTALDKEIIKLITNNTHITHMQLSDELSKSVRTIERRIKILKEAGLIKRIGAKKTGCWQVQH